MSEEPNSSAPLPSGPARFPWYVWCTAAVILCAAVGLQWDVAWHRSVGMDTFWTPRHYLMYTQPIVDGITGGSLIFLATFSKRLRDRFGPMVSVWGLRGPLGAFFLCWGSVAMLAAAVFDMWWHGTYGIDVMVLSPPHSMLYLGASASMFGTLVLVMSFANRFRGRPLRLREMFVLGVPAVILILSFTETMEWTAVALMHTSLFYCIVAAIAPLALAIASQIVRTPWSSTIVASIYTAGLLVMIGIFPLVEAVPRIGPVYRREFYMLPPGFPLLLVIPAFAMDWIRPKLMGMNRELQSMTLGAIFVTLFCSAQWPFARFLGSSIAARRWFDPVDNPTTLFAATWDPTAIHLFLGFVAAFAIAAATTRIGIQIGDWLNRVDR